MPNGITYKRSTSGKVTSVTIDLKKHGAELEDFLDSAEIARRQNEPTTPLRQVLACLDKKHGIKSQVRGSIQEKVTEWKLAQFLHPA